MAALCRDAATTRGSICKPARPAYRRMVSGVRTTPRIWIRVGFWSPAANPMRAVMIITRAIIEPKRRTIVIRGAVIDGGAIIRIPIHRRPVGRVNCRLLIHVEIDSLRYAVLRAEPLACSEKSDLFKLVRCQRQG